MNDVEYELKKSKYERSRKQKFESKKKLKACIYIEITW